MPLLWAEKSSPQIDELTKTYRIAILPVGSTEQHGPHLATGTDHLIIWEISKQVADRVDALLLPLLPYGFSEDHFPKAGTITLSAETLRQLIKEISKSLSRNGVKHVVVMSGHAGHLAQLADVVYELNVMGEIGDTKVHNLCPYAVTPLETLGQILEEDMFIHAEEVETSLMLYLRPELVDISKAVKEIPDFIPKGLTTPNFLEAIRVVTTSKFLGRDFKTGVCGDATLATREKGEKIFNLLVQAVVDAVKHVTSE